MTSIKAPRNVGTFNERKWREELTKEVGEGLFCGALKVFHGTTAGQVWLLCDGTAISRAAYAPLFAKIGTTYGAGDGSTTFNLPDLQNHFSGMSSLNFFIHV